MTSVDLRRKVLRAHPINLLAAATVNETRRRSSSISMDDTMIDYTSMMGLEDMRRRFSEDVVNMDPRTVRG
jgi:hypothetical protein